MQQTQINEQSKLNTLLLNHLNVVFLDTSLRERWAEMFRDGCSSVAAAFSDVWPLWAPGLLVPQGTAGHQRATAGHSRNGFWSCFSGPDLKLYLVQPLTDWAPSILVSAALSVQVNEQPLMLPSFLASHTWEFQPLLISAFLPSGP